LTERGLNHGKHGAHGKKQNPIPGFPSVCSVYSVVNLSSLPRQSGLLFAIFAVTDLKRRDRAVYVMAASIDDPFVLIGQFTDSEPVVDPSR
jgi:hypothetical protein